MIRIEKQSDISLEIFIFTFINENIKIICICLLWFLLKFLRLNIDLLIVFFLQELLFELHQEHALNILGDG